MAHFSSRLFYCCLYIYMHRFYMSYFGPAWVTVVYIIVKHVDLMIHSTASLSLLLIVNLSVT